MVGYDHLTRQLENKPSITLSEPFKSNAETMVKAKIRLLEHFQHLTVNSRRLNGYLVRKHLGRHYHILKITH
jgi:hypothetical protein